MKQRRLVSAVSLAAILAFGLFSRARAQTAKADLRNAQGETVGSATLTQEGAAGCRAACGIITK